jgi:hypothetical protein
MYINKICLDVISQLALQNPIFLLFYAKENRIPLLFHAKKKIESLYFTKPGLDPHVVFVVVNKAYNFKIE